MTGWRAAVGVGGGIAAYKACELVRELERRGIQTQVVMTAAAQQFVQPLTFAALTGRKVITSLFGSTPEEVLASSVEHIGVARANDLLVVAPATADLLACLAARWAVLARGDQDLAMPVLDPIGAPGTGGPVDPLPPDLCGEQGLPPGVALPPGTTVLPGQPTFSPATDWTKVRRCQLAGTVATRDPEAVHRHFVAQCAALGWWYDRRGDERLPTDPLPGPFYDRDVQMVLGECRTRAGSPTDRRQRQPWYLAWGVTLRPGADRLELIVEVRDTSRIGGRP